MNDQAVKESRVIAAFLIAPLIMPFVLLLPFPGDSYETTPTDGSVVVTLLFHAVYGLPVAYIAELILGVPAWGVFRNYRIRSLPAFAGAGALMGWLVSVTMWGLGSTEFRRPVTDLFNPSSNWFLSCCVVAGSACATLFRVIVFYGTKS